MCVSINEAIERAKETCERNIKQSIEYHEDCLKERVANIERAFLARCLLSSAGFAVELPAGYWSVDELELRVEKTELTKVRDALGCRLKWKGNTLEDANQRLIRTIFQPSDFPNVNIYFISKLPRKRKGKPAPKCKIKKVRETYTTLVCERA